MMATRASSPVDFTQGADQSLRLGDNTGERLANNVQLVFDAVRLTRIETETGSGSGSDETDTMPGEDGGCSTGGGHMGLASIAVLGILRRRRSNK